MGTLLGNVVKEANAAQCAQQTGILMGVLGSCKLWKHKVHFLGSSLVSKGLDSELSLLWPEFNPLLENWRSYKLCG